MSKKELSASEALYAFAAWLTSRKEAITFSSKHSAAPVAELVNTFIKTNNLPDPDMKNANIIMPDNRK